MNDFYTFASNNPYLTFFLLLIILQTVGAIFRSFAVAIRGWPPKEEKKKKDGVTIS